MTMLILILKELGETVLDLDNLRKPFATMRLWTTNFSIACCPLPFLTAHYDTALTNLLSLLL